MQTCLNTLANVASLGVLCNQGITDASSQKTTKKSSQLHTRHSECCIASIRHTLGLEKPTTSSLSMSKTSWCIYVAVGHTNVLQFAKSVLKQMPLRLCSCSCNNTWVAVSYLQQNILNHDWQSTEISNELLPQKQLQTLPTREASPGGLPSLGRRQTTM